MLLNFSIGKFYGIDSIVELLIIIVSLIISYSSYKIYRLIKEDNYKLFSLSFLALAFSFVFKILSNLTIFNQVKIEKANFVIYMVSQWEYMELVNFMSFNLYKIFNIIGFILLFLIITKTSKKEKFFIFIYLSIIAVLFSIYFNFIFHITIAIILLYLTIHFYENYKDKRSTNSLLVFLAFIMMLISHVFFVFSDIDDIFYLIGEFLLLVSFSNLLINQWKMKKNKVYTRISLRKKSQNKLL
jgi:hypothetical protein